MNSFALRSVGGRFAGVSSGPARPYSPMLKKQQADASVEPILARVWLTLGAVRRVLFTAESGANSRMHWNGEGVGSVCADARTHGIWLVERGSFLQTSGSTRRVPFKASWHWELGNERLSLSHERYGAGAAVFLCDFVACDETRLVCDQPHLCGADSYHCTLALTGRGFDASWRITGPRKDERLEYHYLTD
jgi:hypothetical protein